VITLEINGEPLPVSSPADLRQHLSASASEQYREVWLSIESGPSLCVLINGNCGWLMYLRDDGDAGFSSRNPSFAENTDRLIEYRLSNGQIDEFPASWAVDETSIAQALEYFLRFKTRPPIIAWHDES
jgi:hypothetical protein